MKDYELLELAKKMREYIGAIPPGLLSGMPCVDLAAVDRVIKKQEALKKLMETQKDIGAEEALILMSVAGFPVNKRAITRNLYEMCDTYHSGDCSGCLVAQCNGGEPPDTQSTGYGCDTFKNGNEMFDFIQIKMQDSELLQEIV